MSRAPKGLVKKQNRSVYEELLVPLRPAIFRPLKLSGLVLLALLIPDGKGFYEIDLLRKSSKVTLRPASRKLQRGEQAQGVPIGKKWDMVSVVEPSIWIYARDLMNCFALFERFQNPFLVEPGFEGIPPF